MKIFDIAYQRYTTVIYKMWFYRTWNLYCIWYACIGPELHWNLITLETIYSREIRKVTDETSQFASSRLIKGILFIKSHNEHMADSAW